MEDPANGEDAENHGGDEGARVREQVHGGDHHEDGDVLEVILVGSKGKGKRVDISDQLVG